MIGNADATADIVPVDICINMMITSACYVYVSEMMKCSKKNLFILNCTSDTNNRLTWHRLQDLTNKISNQTPSHDLVLLPYFQFTKYKLIKYIRIFTEQILPAILIDTFLRVLKKKPL